MMGRKNHASRLRQRLTLQEEVRTPDNAGGYVRSWKDVATLWAEIIPVSGRERFFAGKIESPATHRILMRYRSDITPAHRLVFEKRAFNIRHVANVGEENAMLEIMAEEGVAA